MEVRQGRSTELVIRQPKHPYVLDAQKKVHGQGHATYDLTWGIVGEAPGRDEELEGRPFVGKSGEILDKALAVNGINRLKCWATNAITVRPPANNIKTDEGIEAVKAHKDEFWAEIEYLVKERGITTFLALGGTVMKMFGIEGQITKVRGSVFGMNLTWQGPATDYTGAEKHDFIVVPTFHPSYLLHSGHMNKGGSSISLYADWYKDIKKAATIGKEGYTFPKEDFNTDPRCWEVEKFVDEMIADRSLVALDLETDGLNPRFNNIITIGLGKDKEKAMSIRLRDDRNLLHHPEKEHRRIMVAVQKLLDEAYGFILQNGSYDIRWMLTKAFRFDWAKLKHDTISLHHVLDPEAFHNLGYITSIYGKTPFWKEITDWANKSIYDRDPETLGEYNCRDCVVLHQILPNMLKGLEEMGEASKELYYEESLKMIRVSVHMEIAGTPWSEKKKKNIQESLEQEIPETENEMRRIGDLPPEFEFKASHLVKALYGFEASYMERHRETLKKSDPKTKKYKEADQTVKAVDGTDQIWKYSRAFFQPMKGKSGVPGIDDKARLKLTIAATKRLEALKKLKRREDKHRREEADIQRLLKFISKYNRLTSLKKLRDTYLKYKAGQDGRIHASWNATGTVSGRFSCSNPNLMNLPKPGDQPDGATDYGGMFRGCITAPEGYKIITPDYSNLEVGTVAYESGEPNLIRIFEERLNQHDINTRTLFGLEKDDPLWKPARKAAKTFQFGALNYGGSENTVYTSMVESAPELGLTREQYRAAEKAYYRDNPKYLTWKQTTQDDSVSTRMGKNAFGRIRIYYGPSYKIEREALNFPCQSAAASIINRATIRLVDIIEDEYPEIELVMQVHDQLVFIVPDEQVDEFCRIIKQEMEAPIEFYGTPRVFPVDIEVGPDFQNVKEYEVSEEEKVGA